MRKLLALLCTLFVFVGSISGGPRSRKSKAKQQRIAEEKKRRRREQKRQCKKRQGGVSRKKIIERTAFDSGTSNKSCSSVSPSSSTILPPADGTGLTPEQKRLFVLERQKKEACLRRDQKRKRDSRVKRILQDDQEYAAYLDPRSSEFRHRKEVIREADLRRQLKRDTISSPEATRKISEAARLLSDDEKTQRIIKKKMVDQTVSSASSVFQASLLPESSIKTSSPEEEAELQAFMKFFYATHPGYTGLKGRAVALYALRIANSFSKKMGRGTRD